MKKPFEQKLSEHFAYLAPPLELISDNAFRTLCYRHGADVTFTEMIRLKGLVRSNSSTWSRMNFQDDTPTIIQLLVNNEADVRTFLSNFRAFQGFEGFNMNLGCPSPDVIRIGLGCASIKRIAKTQCLINIFREFGYSISLKLRLGMNTYERKKKAYLNLIKNTTPDFFIVHARDGSQTYAQPADFSVYDECTATGKLIIANGDISRPEHIVKLKAAGIRGAMIGRAAVQNPAVFDLLKGKKVPSADELRREYLLLAQEYNSKPEHIRMVLAQIRNNKTVKDKFVEGSVRG
jgi:tRNA-dihydrouridine synthase